MTSLRSVAGPALLCITILLLWSPSLLRAQGASSVAPVDLEMPAVGVSEIRNRKIDPAVLSSFRIAYESAIEAPRPIFEKYLPLVGAAALLDFLENKYPVCHGQSHELGKALFAASRDIGTALRECGARCTSGCMHGVVSEAFGSSTPEAITKSMNTFCGEGEMARLHKPGNCAHGLGHALMFVNSGDVNRSVDACLGFANESMQYYCVTGVFMERMSAPPSPTSKASSIFQPCDQETLFPSACYRYKGVELLHKFGEPMRVASECLRLEGSQRAGCFHGLGHAATQLVFEQPKKVASICSRGTHDDQVMCVEGVIEKLAEAHERRAKAACTFLGKDLRLVCDESVKRKMYSLDKPTLALYYDKEAVARRRAAATKASDTQSQTHHH